MFLDLANLEASIESARADYVAVGAALAAIRDEKFYKQPSFEAYCRERWGLKGKRSSQLIVSAQLAAEFQAAGVPVPTVEFQARTLAYMPDVLRQRVWLKALEISGNKPSVTYINKARRLVDQAIAEMAAVYEQDDAAFASILRGRQRSQRNALAAGITSLQGLCAGFDQITVIAPDINAEEAAQWVRDLSGPLRALRSLATKLKEHAHANDH